MIDGLLGFWHYMFAPIAQPFYTGAFWSNQVQWTVVTLPTLFIALRRMEARHQKRHEELTEHLRVLKETQK